MEMYIFTIVTTHLCMKMVPGVSMHTHARMHPHTCTRKEVISSTQTYH